MSTKIYLTFSSPSGKNSEKVQWNVRSTPLAERWLAQMINATKNKKYIREQRFVGWQCGDSALNLLVNKLNESISIINQYYGARYQIKERAYLGMPQEVLNALHHHFELLIGQTWNPSILIKNIPRQVFTAIRRLNDYIHDYEAAIRARIDEKRGFPTIRFFQFQYAAYKLFDLTQQDLSEFSFASEMGDLVTNYCQLGKTWIEVFYDRDNDIHPENISPLRYYSASFNANFFETSFSESLKITQEVKNFIQTRGGDPNDTKLALGHQVYASLPADSFLRTCSEKDRVKFFSERMNVSEILIKNGAQEVIRKFTNPNDYYERRDSRIASFLNLFKQQFRS